MAKLFLTKIKSGEINPATGDVWKIEDVPMLWREEVVKLLELTDENTD